MKVLAFGLGSSYHPPRKISGGFGNKGSTKRVVLVLEQTTKETNMNDDYCTPEHEGPIETIDPRTGLTGCCRCGDTWGGASLYVTAQEEYLEAIDDEDYARASAIALGVKSGFYTEDK